MVKKRKKVMENLLKYCELDTEGMVLIIDKLKGLIKQHENNKKVTFEEKVLFYVMEKNLKCK